MRKKERSIQLYNLHISDLSGKIIKTHRFPLNLADGVKCSSKASYFHKTDNEEKMYRLTEPISGVKNTVTVFDGTGGWVYNPEQGILGINVKGMEQYTTNLSAYLGREQTASINKRIGAE